MFAWKVPTTNDNILNPFIPSLVVFSFFLSSPAGLRRQMRKKEWAYGGKNRRIMYGKYVCIFLGTCSSHYYFARRWFYVYSAYMASAWLPRSCDAHICGCERIWCVARVMEYHKLSYRSFKYNFNLRIYMSAPAPAPARQPFSCCLLIFAFFLFLPRLAGRGGWRSDKTNFKQCAEESDTWHSYASTRHPNIRRRRSEERKEKWISLARAHKSFVNHPQHMSFVICRFCIRK